MPARTDYLVDEVLDNVDVSTRHFAKSAILRSMNDALIVRVTGEETARCGWRRLSARGLFLQRMDDTGEWFSYHPLFGSFLRASVASGNWRRNYRRSTVRRKATGWN